MECETAQDNMINIIEAMQMVGRKGRLEGGGGVMVNGNFCSNYALICVDGRCGVDSFSRPILTGDNAGEETLCVLTKQLRKNRKGRQWESQIRWGGDLNVRVKFNMKI